MRVVPIQLHGYLSFDTIDAVLGDVEPHLTRGCVLLVDCLGMTGYDADARAAFVSWHRGHRELIRRTAILTDKPLWHMIVSAMSLASGTPMRAFDERRAALAWLDDQARMAP